MVDFERNLIFFQNKLVSSSFSFVIIVVKDIKRFVSAA